MTAAANRETDAQAESELPSPTELRAMRIVLGINQAEVGEAVGIRQVQVSEFEREVRDLDDETVEAMHQYYREAHR